jgi:hypothetical protein
MKALISTIEPRQTGYRVAEVVANGATFPVSAELFWTDFPSNLDPALAPEDQYWYDPADQAIKLIPQPDPIPETTYVADVIPSTPQ